MPNAQYVIDIAAQMPAGEATTAQLDSMTASLVGAGKGADHFQQAIQQVSGQLDTARAAAVSANSALQEGNTQYAELEKAALKAGRAAEKAALKNEGVVPEDLAARARDADAELRQYSVTLAVLETEAKDATAGETALAKSLVNVRKLSAHADKSIAGNAESIEKLRGGLASVPGPAGKLGSALLAPVQGFAKLSSTMGTSKAAMLVGVTAAAALAVAIVAVGVAAAVAAVHVAAWAVGLADSARSASLSQDALEALNPAYGAVRGQLEGLTKETGQTAGDLNALTKSLIDAKVSAEDMPAALRAAALAETALGKGGSADFISRMKDGKLAVQDFAAESRDKFGGIVAKQMKGLDAQSGQLTRNIGALFGGLNIDPVLAGMKLLVDLFDENTAAGSAMKFLFESVFQPLIDQAENAALVVEAFALGFLIGLTKVYIALKPVIKGIADFLGFDDVSVVDTLSSVTEVAKILAYVFTGVVVAVGAFGAAVAVAGAAVVLPFALIAATIVGIIAAISSVVSYVQAVNLSELGANILKGLAAGITGAAGFVVDAVRNAISGAIGAAKSLLGIASPSKVFAGIGDDTGQGFVGAVEATTPDAQDAVAAMVAPPPPPPGAAMLASPLARVPAAADRAAPGAAPALASAESAPADRPSVSLTGPFNFYGVEGAEDAVQRFEEMLTRVVEGDAAQLGGEAAPA